MSNFLFQLKFLEMCGEYGIDEGLALENSAVVSAIRARDAHAMRKAFETEF